MATYEMTGTVKQIMDEQTFPSGFSKREFVVTSEDEYPQPVRFVLFKEKAKLLDAVRSGERIKVSFGIKGNEYNGRFYVDLNAFKVERMDVDGSSVEYDGADEPVDEDADTVLPF
jgi:single-strand DNA-binding protein